MRLLGQLLSMGLAGTILGAYLGRIFQILQNKPPYLVERTVGMHDR